MLALADVKLLATSQISKATVAQVQAVVSDGRGGKLAAALHAVSKKLMAKEHEGVVPTNPAELKKLKLDDTVIGLLSNLVFGSVHQILQLGLTLASSWLHLTCLTGKRPVQSCSPR